MRLVPRAELVNTLEYEQQAKLKLAPAVYSLVAGVRLGMLRPMPYEVWRNRNREAPSTSIS